MSIPAGYTQIPSTGLLVRNNDGSGPFYLDSGGSPQPMPVSSGPTPNLTALSNPMYTGSSFSVGTNSGNGRATDLQVMAPFAFTGVRLVYSNPSTAGSVTINRSAVGATGAAGVNGNTVTWAASDVLFGGLGSVTIPAATANGGRVIPSYVISDALAISSVARSDAGTLPILRIRTHWPDSSVIDSANVSVLNVVAGNPGFIWASATTSALSSALKTYSGVVVEAGQLNTPVGVIFEYADGVFDLAAFGDSTMQGTTTTSNNSGYPMYAMYSALNGGKRLSTLRQSVSGMRHETSTLLATQFIAEYQPKFCLIHSWSTNDVGSNSQAGFDAAWARVEAFIIAAQAEGVIPVIATPAPQTTISATLIQGQIDRVLALTGNVVKFDLNAVLRDTTVNSFNPAYFTDGTHYNDAGHIAAGAALVTALGI